MIKTPFDVSEVKLLLELTNGPELVELIAVIESKVDEKFAATEIVEH
ncbi:MAG: hypothetical protein M0Z25_01395 [Nitrospiraceae bacterium]|nr:hypothetical protein [Nitrospiraceae bacterium]